MALRTDYKDDILDTSVNEKRVYNLIDQSGNVVMSGLSLEDVTVYSQVGDEFSSSAVNEAFDNINNRNLKTYTSFEQLGLTSPTTTTAIYKALSINSMAAIMCNPKMVTDLPYGVLDGILTITKKAGPRCEIRFVEAYVDKHAPANMYIGQLAGSSGTGLTWTKITTETDLTEITSVRKLKTYTSLSQLGLSNSATLIETWNALPENAELWCSASDLTDESWALPNKYCTLYIKKQSVNRGVLKLYSKAGKCYVMGMSATTNLPEGFWRKYGEYIELTGTLTAGATSITLTDDAITTDSKFDFYTSIYGVSPTNVTVADGSITLEFDAQETDMNVEVRVM